MIVTRDLTDEMQPDAAVEFVARLCSGVADAGAALRWWWLGESAVRLYAERPGAPGVTIDLRELGPGTCFVGGSRTVLAVGDVQQILLGRRRAPRRHGVAA